MFPNKDDITFGGFIKSNIKRALLKDMLESGRPYDMLRAIRESLDEIENEINDADNDDRIEKYWDDSWSAIS